MCPHYLIQFSCQCALFTWMQDEGFPFNLALKCEVILNLCVKCRTRCTKPARSEPDHAEPNQGLHCKIVRSALFWVATQHGGVIPCWHFGTSPCFKGHEKIQENTAQRKLTDTVFFLGGGHCPLSNFFKELQHFGIRLCFCFQAKQHLTWWTPWIELFLITGHCRNSNLIRYVPENRSSPRVVTRKWLLKN